MNRLLIRVQVNARRRRIPPRRTGAAEFNAEFNTDSTPQQHVPEQLKLPRLEQATPQQTTFTGAGRCDPGR
ncbi:MAG: hypothetical protein R2838_24300 [Caldilineaceae bacterium]